MFQSLGLEITGGNLVGIYVKELTDDSVCKTAGLEVGDRLIKVLTQIRFLVLLYGWKVK